MEKMPSKARPFAPAIHSRLATWSDINAMAKIAAQAFDQNDLCGRYMHPHRHEFPADYVRFWRQEIRSCFFEPGVWFLVTTAAIGEGEGEGEELKRKGTKEERGKTEKGQEKGEDGKENEKGKEKEKKEGERVIIVGAAKWKRQGAGRRRYSSWINGTLDDNFLSFDVNSYLSLPSIFSLFSISFLTFNALTPGYYLLPFIFFFHSPHFPIQNRKPPPRHPSPLSLPLLHPSFISPSKTNPPQPQPSSTPSFITSLHSPAFSIPSAPPTP